MQGYTNRLAYKSAVALALGAAAILVWLSLGVGIIGKDGDIANALYFGVIAIGIIGAVITRFRPRGMARTLIAMALAQAAIGLTAASTGMGLPWSGPAEILLLNGFFIALFMGAAWLFGRAAR